MSLPKGKKKGKGARKTGVAAKKGKGINRQTVGMAGKSQASFNLKGRKLSPLKKRAKSEEKAELNKL